MTPIRFPRRHALALLAALPLLASAQTADWPTRPIKLIVPFPAGGQTDAAARYYALKAEASLGQSFVVENRPGANSMIATQLVARAPADGYTLLFNMTAIVSNPVLLPNAGYDALKDFAPVHRTYGLYAVLAVPNDLPVKTLADFTAYAKAAKQPPLYATAGHASSSHYFGELYARQAKVQLTHVPYKGETAILPDLMTGQVQGGFISSAAARQFDGKVRPLAISGNKRAAMLPQLPTFKELGFDGIGNESFAGFFAPAGTPPAVVQKLNQEFNRIALLPETKERLDQLALEPSPPSTPAEFQAVMRRAHDEWTNNRKTVDIKPM